LRTSRNDGSFLKDIAYVKRADIYQNYAELELIDIAKSRELLSDLDGRLSLRKFEVVEPSLNSIFINVVGLPPEPSQPIPALMGTPIPVSVPSVSDDPRVRKAKISMVLASLTCVGLIVLQGIQKDPSFSTIGLLIVGVLASIFQYIRMKKNVERDLLKKNPEGGAL
jgi:hypothetical protein